MEKNQTGLINFRYGRSAGAERVVYYEDLNSLPSEVLRRMYADIHRIMTKRALPVSGTLTGVQTPPDGLR